VIEVALSGHRGRLGARIDAAIGASGDLAISARIGRGDAFAPVGQVLVECAPRGAALEHVSIAAEAGMSAVIATTGFDAEERRRIEQAAARAAIVLAPNLSLGVAVLVDLVEKASRALAAYDIEIFEMHHNQKKDAPSGTAWALARAAAKGRGQDAERDAMLARSGDIGARGKQEIGIQTLRGGGVIGEHTVLLVGDTERLELVHRAASRDVFAAGAVHAARFVAGRAPGLYSMRDVLGLV